MKIKVIPVGSYEANCYVLMEASSKEIVIIDPGAEPNIIINEINDMGGTVKNILLTHGHADHTGAVSALVQRYNVPVYINNNDKKLIDKGSLMFDKFISNELNVKFIKDNDIISIGNLDIKCIETPGHTPGGICFLVENNLFSGDTLFSGSIGRTDFDGGDFSTIISSIREKLFILPENTVVYPGHGPQSDINQEKKYNPFFNM